MNYLLQLSQGTAATIGACGGKGMNLARLIEAGLLVPETFILTTQAYNLFVARSNLRRVIADNIGEIDSFAGSRLESASANIRKAFDAAPIPAELVSLIETAWRALAPGPVAVRSSASAEDLPEASFAGQHDSFLGIGDLQSLELSVKKCWSSLWTARAIAYRAKTGIPANEVSMAVILQAGLPAESSGVIFTVDPDKGIKGGMLVNGCKGFGEKLVGGDEAAVSWNIPRNSTGDNISSPAASKLLSREDCDLLYSNAVKIECLYGRPMDIEWVKSRADIWIVQARPITPGLARQVPSLLTRLRNRLRNVLLEYFPFPLYPFDRSSTQSLIDSLLGLAQVFGFRCPRAADLMPLRDCAVVGLEAHLPTPSLRLLYSLPLLPFRILVGLRVSPQLSQSAWRSDIRIRLAANRERNVQGCTDADILDFLEKSISIRDQVLLRRSPYFWAGFASTVVAQLVFRVLYRRRWQSAYLAATTSCSMPTSRINALISQLSCIANRSPSLADTLRTDRPLDDLKARSDKDAKAFISLLDDLTREFGSRTPDLIPLPSRPTWADSPSLIFALVNPCAGFESSKRPEQNPENQWSFLRFCFQFFIRRAAEMNLERDNVIHLYEETTVPIRTAMREIGSRLSASGFLEVPDDIRFLTIEEAADALLGKHSGHIDIVARKLSRPLTVANWQPIRTKVRRSTNGAIVLRGVGASAGTFAGPVRVISGVEDFDSLCRDEILVCMTSNPSWTPLFSKAGAVVTELGSALSHAAIVAREYGIPAVLNAEGATAVLKTGTTYLVDGDTGEVRLATQEQHHD